MIPSISKLDPNKYIKDLTQAEFDRLRAAVERIEGWEIGREDWIEKWYISKVHKTHGVIREYLVNKSWLSKESALKLAEEGKLHATIVRLKNGTIYLRAEYGNQFFIDIS